MPRRATIPPNGAATCASSIGDGALPAWEGFGAGYAWVCGPGLLPTLLLNLQTIDRREGRVVSTILVVVAYQGRRYVVSMLGEQSEWVQNVRAAGGQASIKRGRSRPVHLTEMAPHERAPILKAWARVAMSGRHHLPVTREAPVAAFEAIAADYPVFRLDPASGDG